MLRHECLPTWIGILQRILRYQDVESVDACLCIFVSHRFSARCMSPNPCLNILKSQDLLKNPSPDSYLMSQHPLRWLRIFCMMPIDISICLYFRILCKICVSGFISQHLYISGSSARSISPDPYINIHIHLRILCKIHISMQAHISTSLHLGILDKINVFGFISQLLRISGPSARSMCPIHVVAFRSQHPNVSQDPWQDPYLQAHVSASLHLGILDKIHVLRFISQHLRISGSSARSMWPIHVLAFMSQHPHVSQDPLQDPCLWTHISASLYLRILHKIHVLGFMSQHLFISRILCKIHVFGFMSQHLRHLRILCKIHVSDSYLSIHQNGSSRKYPSSDSCLRIFKFHGFLARPMSPDPCRSIHLYLRILCKIHVSGSMSQYLYISGASARSMFPIHVLTFLSSDFVALRRRNANFDLWRCVLCGPA